MHQLPSTQNSGCEVLVVGEALVDVVPRAKGNLEYPGGSPANVAFGLGRLGIETSLVTAIGNDPRGRLIEKHLASAGVGLFPGSRRLNHTSSATVRIAEDGSASYDIDMDWNIPYAEPERWPRVLHAGSVATFLTPGSTTVRAWMAQAGKESLVTYDPNIRPALLGSHAEALQIFEELLQLTDIVKLSDEDARWLYPKLSPSAALNRVLGLGPTVAAITLGSKGSLLGTRDTQVVVEPERTIVVDSIGAGDSYMSALIYGLVRYDCEEFTTDILRRLGQLASSAAAITVSRAGANPPTASEIATGRQDAATLSMTQL